MGSATNPMARAGTAGKTPQHDENAGSDVEVSEDDVSFFAKNQRFASFLASGRDLKEDGLRKPKEKKRLKSEDAGEAALAAVEKRARVASWAGGPNGGEGRQGAAGLLSVHPADALPVKLADGRLVYRRAATDADEGAPSVRGASKESRFKGRGRPEGGEEEGRGPAGVPKEEDEGGEEEEEEGEEGVSEDEKASLKKEAGARREVRKTEKPRGIDVQVEQDPEERRQSLKVKMAQLGTAILANPEGQVKALQQLQVLCEDQDPVVSSLAVLSLCAIFRDIIPGYRIRIPTETERAQPVSKEVRKLWDYEAALLQSYEAFVALLVAVARSSRKRAAAVRALCALLKAVPHFNCASQILQAVVPRMDSPDASISDLCCEAVRDVLRNEARHGGDATLEAVELVADLIRRQWCIASPAVIQVFLALKFDEALLQDKAEEGQRKGRRGHKGQKGDAAGAPDSAAAGAGERLSKKQRKAEKRKMAAQLKREVVTDLRQAEGGVKSEAERRRQQSQVLSAVFETYFRILKTTHEAANAPAPAPKTRPASGARFPLLEACLEGLTAFCHLLSVEFLPDVLSLLRKLAATPSPARTAPAPSGLTAGAPGARATGTAQGGLLGGGKGTREGGGVGEGEGGEGEGGGLSAAERLRCLSTAQRVMAANLDALNVDMGGFLVELFHACFTVPLAPGDPGPAFAEALEASLMRGPRQTDMQRCAAFVKRLACVALQAAPGVAVASLVAIRFLLTRHPRCRALLDPEPGGAPVGAGLVATYNPLSSDPDLSGALSSALWELSLLRRHYHPAVCQLASDIARLDSTGAAGAGTSTGPSAVTSQAVSEGSGQRNSTGATVPDTLPSLNVPGAGVPATAKPSDAVALFSCEDGCFRPPVTCDNRHISSRGPHRAPQNGSGRRKQLAVALGAAVQDPWSAEEEALRQRMGLAASQLATKQWAWPLNGG